MRLLAWAQQLIWARQLTWTRQSSVWMPRLKRRWVRWSRLLRMDAPQPSETWAPEPAMKNQHELSSGARELSCANSSRHCSKSGGARPFLQTVQAGREQPRPQTSLRGGASPAVGLTPGEHQPSAAVGP